MAFLILTVQFNKIPAAQSAQRALIDASVKATETRLNTLLGAHPEWGLNVVDVTTDQTELIPMDDHDRRKELERIERDLDNPTELERIISEKLTRRGQ